MIKALLLIFEPANTWENTIKSQRSLVFILCVYLIPLLLLSCGGEVYGVMTWGEKQGAFGTVSKLPEKVAIYYGIGQFLVSLVVVFVGTKIVKSVAESFHGRPTWTQCFTLVAYSMGPLFLIRLVDAWPAMNEWVTWGIGLGLSMPALYHGLPRVLRPDPAHAFGLYLISFILLIMVTGLGRFLTLLMLRGNSIF